MRQRTWPIAAFLAMVLLLALLLVLGHFGSEKWKTTPNSEMVSDIRTGASIVALQVGRTALYDPHLGILRNPLGRGRPWERPAAVQIYRAGNLLFESAVGIRIHGEVSRVFPKKNFRLNLRARYGLPEFNSTPFFEGKQFSLNTLVLLNDEYGTFPMARNIAADISRQLGAIVPRLELVRLYLNEEFVGHYSLSEAVNRTYLRGLLGHEQFAFAQTRNERNLTRLRLYEKELLWWAFRGKEPLENIESKVRMESYFRWLLATLYYANTDAMQGPIVWDRTDDRWFWVHWDLDRSFGELNPLDRSQKAGPAWQHDTMNSLKKEYRHHLNGKLLEQVLKNKELRTKFRKHALNQLESILTKEFLDSLVSHYRKSAVIQRRELDAELNTYAAFFSNRSQHLKKMIEREF